MPYSTEHKAHTRARIVAAARRLFNHRGFGQVSIDEIMAEAGLTRGGFYNHFRRKDDLYAEAITHVLRCEPGTSGRPASVRARQLVTDTCPTTVFPTWMHHARSSPTRPTSHAAESARSRRTGRCCAD